MEKKTKHTPGPWEAVANEGDDPNPAKVYVTAKSRWTHPTVADCSYMDDDESEANARLIAAAPDLLGALLGMAAGGCFCEIGIGHPSRTDHSDACKKAMAAIAKAEGK